MSENLNTSELLEPKPLQQTKTNVPSPPKLNSQRSFGAQHPKNATEIMLKAVRYMTPLNKLKTNKKLLSNVMSYKEAILRNLNNPKRNENEAWQLYDYVRDFKFFVQYANQDNMEPEAILHICKNIRYEKYKKDTVIFKEGDESNGKVYILFSGEVNVVVSKMDVYE
jgi:hypothetical protein